MTKPKPKPQFLTYLDWEKHRWGLVELGKKRPLDMQRQFRAAKKDLEAVKKNPLATDIEKRIARLEYDAAMGRLIVRHQMAWDHKFEEEKKLVAEVKEILKKKAEDEAKAKAEREASWRRDNTPPWEKDIPEKG